MSELSTLTMPLHLPFRNADDSAEFGALPDDCKADIRRKYAAIREAAQTANARGVSAIWERHAALIAGNKGGCISGKRLRNIGSDYLKSAAVDRVKIGDWRILWNTSKWHRADYRFTALPKAFIEHEWKPRICRELAAAGNKGSRMNVGGMAEAHRKLLTDWKAALRDGTHPFKGYDRTPPKAPGLKHPKGWSYANLTHEHCIPSEAERLAFRRGVGAARVLLPYVRSTRAEVLACQRIEFDDYCPDYSIRFGDQIVKPLQLSAYDFGTGCFVASVYKPQFLRADGTKDGWKAAHIPLFLASQFTRNPYDCMTGTVLVDEGGTARADEATMEILAEETGGRIWQDGADPSRYMLAPRERPAVQRANRERLGQLTGFQGGDKGDPNRKRMEAMHRVLGIALGNLPGFTGSNYTQKPEWMAGVIKDEEKLLKASLSLSPERAASLQFNLLSFHTFCAKAREALHTMNCRDDHAMEGWARFTLDSIATREDGSEWTPLDELSQLPTDTAAALLAIVENKPELFTPQRRLSPWQAWQRETRQGIESGRLRRLSPWAAAEIIARAGRAEPELRTVRTRTARTAYLVVEDTTVAMLQEPVFYKARIRQRDGSERELRNGEDVQVIFNPFEPAVLFVRSPEGRFLGVAMEDKAINPNDKAETLRAQAEARSRRAERLAPIKASMAADVSEVTDRRRHNADVMDTSRPFLPQEKRENAALAAAREALRQRQEAARVAD